MWEVLFSFSIAVTALAIAPGPDNIFVLTQSVVYGSSYGIAVTTGLVSGCLVHTTLVAFGISKLMTQSPTVFYGIKIAGALYLLYLAWSVLKSDASISINSTTTPQKNYLQLYKQGVIMNVLNPKVTLFFMALFPGFIWNTESDTITQFYILGFIFMGISFLVFSLIAILSGKVADFIRQNKHTGVFLKWLQISVFIGIAIFLLLP